MRLREARLLADQNIAPLVVAELRRIGFDVLSVRESDLNGADDFAIIARAIADDRVIVTHDGDFGMHAVLAAGAPPVPHPVAQPRQTTSALQTRKRGEHRGGGLTSRRPH